MNQFPKAEKGEKLFEKKIYKDFFFGYHSVAFIAEDSLLSDWFFETTFPETKHPNTFFPR